MVDLQETPAVPPTDFGGDERAGLWIAGGVLIVLGWGIAVGLNVALHLLAPAGGWTIESVTLFPKLGLLAEITAGVGVLTGLVGVGILWVARDAPRGPLVLPGSDY